MTAAPVGPIPTTGAVRNDTSHLCAERGAATRRWGLENGPSAAAVITSIELAVAPYGLLVCSDNRAVVGYRLGVRSIGMMTRWRVSDGGFCSGFSSYCDALPRPLAAGV